MNRVTDPALLEELEGTREPVTDEALLRELEGGDDQRAALTAAVDAPMGDIDPDVSGGAYLFDRFKKGVAGLPILFGHAIDAASYPGRKAGEFLYGKSKATEGRAATLISDSMQRALDIENLQPPSEGMRHLGGIAEFAGGSVVTGPAVVAGAARKGLSLAAEIGATVLGGLGSETAGIAGGVVGSVAGAASPVGLSKLIAAGKNRIAPHVGKAGAKSIAGKEISGSLDAFPQSAANISQADQTAIALRSLGAGEFKPTLAGASGAPGIIALEHGIASKSPSLLGEATRRMSENEDVLKRAKDIAFPDVGDLKRGATTRLRDTSKRLEARFEQIERARVAETQRLSSRGQQESGERLRALFEQSEKAAKEVSKAKYAEVYEAAEKAGVSVSMDDVVDVVKGIRDADPNAFQRMPGVFSELISKAKPQGPAAPSILDASGRPILASQQSVKFNFEELHSLYKRVNSDLGTALRTGDFYTQRYLGQLKSTLRDKLRGIEEAGIGDVSTKLKAANKFYETKFAPAFREGVGGRIASVNRFGEVVKDEEIVRRFFTPSGLDDFNMIYGSSPEAQAVLKDGVIGMFRNSAVRSGMIDPKAAVNFLRKNDEVLSKMPDIREALTNTASFNASLVERSQRLTARQKLVDHSFVAKVAKTENTSVVIENALTDKKRLLALVSLAPDDASRSAVARAIADAIPDAAAKEGLDPLAFVLRHEDTLRPALARLGPDHLRNLKTLAGGQTILGRVNLPKTSQAPFIGDYIEQLTGSTGQSILSQGRAVMVTRQGSPWYAVSNILARFGLKARREHAEQLQRVVIYDPSLARELVAASKGPATRARGNRLLHHLASSGVRIASSEMDAQE